MREYRMFLPRKLKRLRNVVLKRRGSIEKGSLMETTRTYEVRREDGKDLSIEFVEVKGLEVQFPEDFGDTVWDVQVILSDIQDILGRYDARQICRKLGIEEYSNLVILSFNEGVLKFTLDVGDQDCVIQTYTAVVRREILGGKILRMYN